MSIDLIHRIMYLIDNKAIKILIVTFDRTFLLGFRIHSKIRRRKAALSEDFFDFVALVEKYIVAHISNLSFSFRFPLLRRERKIED